MPAVRRFFKLAMLAGVCLATSVGMADAYQQFLTYRIAGTDILAVARAPHVDEDPAALTLTIAPGRGTAAEILIESDGDLDMCQQDLEAIAGAPDTYAEIVIDIDARTMNGVMVVQCTTFQGLFGDR